MKTGRNAECWCGSGKKFKLCHYGRERDEPLTEWQAEAVLKREFKEKKCSAPIAWSAVCSSQIVRAHTVPKSSSLKKIERAGHVYSFVPSFKNLNNNNGILKPELVGINNASTFNGFCSVHDSSIFRPVETSEFIATPEQCFLLAYRATAREAYTKAAATHVAPIRASADRGRDEGFQRAVQSFNALHDLGLDAGRRDTIRIKEEYDRCLSVSDFGKIKSYIVYFENPPEVMCSGAIFPVFDFDGNRLQDLNDLTRNPDELTFSSFWSGSKGCFVFSWLIEEAGACMRLIRSLHSQADEQLTDSLVRFLFEYSENVQISPVWWDGLSLEQSAKLISRMNISANPFLPKRTNPLRDDGLNLPRWKVVGRASVGIDI